MGSGVERDAYDKPNYFDMNLRGACSKPRGRGKGPASFWTGRAEQYIYMYTPVLDSFYFPK